MDKNGAKDVKSESQDEHKEKRDKPENGNHVQPSKSPKKRRKVNHANLCFPSQLAYIAGDLNDRKAKSSHAASTVDDSESTQTELAARGSIDQSAAGSMGPPPPFDRKASAAFGAAVLGQGNPLHLVSPSSVSGMPGNGSNMNQFAGFSDAWLTAQNHYHDMQSYHPNNYMIAPEVTHEFNLLNDFLQTSLLDDGGILSDESQNSPAFSRSAGANDMLPTFGNNSNNNGAANNNRATAANALSQMLPPPNLEQGKSISRPGSVVQGDNKDKAREYYLQAADPSGNDTPEERMDRVLKAKYEAGLLKPFNYVKGYARLGTYLDSHIAPSSKQKILRTIDRFRPKFREKAQALTDMELLYVEMWFEKQLMEYDRVFASMAVPACCWRRTGEIFRGNNEMAELLHVPVENLRDGKISLHEILTEESLVRYWEEFGTIAFDPAHDTLLTACTLKSPDDKSTDPVINCCFSFMIQRDNHKIPTLIIGNFLPNDLPARPFVISFWCPAICVLIHEAFADNLLKRLPEARDPPAIDTLHEELMKKLNNTHGFPNLPRGKSRSQRNELDRKGTELWNLCMRLRRDEIPGEPPTRKRLLLRSRVFAFFMIDIARFWKVAEDARPEDWMPLADVVHLMRLALKAGRMCLDDCGAKFANMVFLKASNYSDLLGRLTQTMLGPDDLAECKRLESEYYILRTAMCWKEGNLNVADFMYDKGQPTIQTLDPGSAELLTEVLFEIGKDFSNKGDFKMAVKWLERAYDIINSQELDRLPRDALELRLSVCQAHIHALLGMNTSEASQKAHDLVSYVEQEVGEQPVVLLLRLELLQKAPAEVFGVEAYADILKHMVQRFNFSEAHFKLLIHHARKLGDKSPSMALRMVNGMLKSNIVSSGREEWVERLVLLRLWMEESQRDSELAIDELMNVLRGVEADLTQPFGASAAVAALTIMWKKIEVNYNQGHFQLAEGWCRIALQSIFENGGPANRSRLCRKLILCALNRNNTEGARQIFHEMPGSARNETMTRYLMYKVALQSGDHDLAADCLERIGAGAAQDPNFLYACVLDAQRARDKICAEQAMKQLLERHEFNEDSPIHLPALLRSNIRIAVAAVEGEKSSARNACIEDVAGLFEQAARAVQRDPKDKQGNRLFTVKELDWFCQNAYNLGLKNSSNWDLYPVLRLFASCLEIINHYPSDLPTDLMIDLRFRTMFSHFVMAAGKISIARTEDNTEKQLQCYLDARKHVKAYDCLFQVQATAADALTKKDLNIKLAALLVFDFEAALALKDHDGLGEILQLARSCKDVRSWKAIGDLALGGKLPGDKLYSTLGIVVNEIWELESMKCDKLAKYTRCMFQAVRLLDAESGQKVILQAIGVAKSAKETPNPYPTEELEWLATTAFNQAVDCYNERRYEECHTWADLATNLAHYASDGGALERQCREKRAKLDFDMK
ncbi:Transcriptional regulator [Colletotrichum sp. SAR 10_98]|nr:Transcriptional regulator [Colletotrichum sp. SAR 10_98]